MEVQLEIQVQNVLQTIFQILYQVYWNPVIDIGQTTYKPILEQLLIPRPSEQSESYIIMPFNISFDPLKVFSRNGTLTWNSSPKRSLLQTILQIVF